MAGASAFMHVVGPQARDLEWIKLWTAPTRPREDRPVLPRLPTAPGTAPRSARWPRGGDPWGRPLSGKNRMGCRPRGDPARPRGSAACPCMAQGLAGCPCVAQGPAGRPGVRRWAPRASGSQGGRSEPSIERGPAGSRAEGTPEDARPSRRPGLIRPRGVRAPRSTAPRPPPSRDGSRCPRAPGSGAAPSPPRRHSARGRSSSRSRNPSSGSTGTRG